MRPIHHERRPAHHNVLPVVGEVGLGDSDVAGDWDFQRSVSLNGTPATDMVLSMSKFSAADALELPVAERLQLVQDIWDSIASAPEALELTEDDKRLIDERLEACRRDPKAGSPWPEVRARIAARRK